MAYRIARRSAAVVGLGLLVSWIGCADEPERNYYNDLVEGGQDATTDDATTEASAADAVVDRATSDDSTGDDGAAPGPDGSLRDAAEASVPDAGRPPRDGDVDVATGTDSGKDAAAEACVPNQCGGCGPMCPTANCCPVTAANPSGCEIRHNGGYVTYYDCEALNADDLQAALDACTTYTGKAADCLMFGCTFDPAAEIICSQGSMGQLCLCWGYAGSVKGFVDNSNMLPGAGGKNCFCPTTTGLNKDPNWN
jgi:hypothetical protein